MLILAIIVAVTFLDQLTKGLILANFALGEGREVIPGLFELTYVRNTGAAWGIFSEQNHWLILLSIVVLIVLLAFRKQMLSDSLPDRIALGLMAAGILGNLIDRIRFSFVIDFLHFYWREHHYPSFNVADSAICIGVGIYISCAVFSHFAHMRAAKSDLQTAVAPGAGDE